MRAIATIAIGFLTGLIIAGFLGDIIDAVNNSAGKVSSAWLISRAEKNIAGGDFLQAIKNYEKALTKIDPKNIQLLAKVKNNLALSKFTIAYNNADKDGIENSISLFLESLEHYKVLENAEAAGEVKINIEEAYKALEELEIQENVS